MSEAMNDLLGCAETLIELKREGYGDEDLKQYALVALAAALRAVEQGAMQECSSR